MNSSKLLVILLALLLFTALSGCAGNTAEEPETPGQDPVTGIIYLVEENRILVIGTLEDVNVPMDYWFERGYRAVYFAVEEDTVIETGDGQSTDEQLARGQKVEVYHEGFLAESYPEQGKALKVVITDPEAAEEFSTDSGRFIGVVAGADEDQLEVKISGVPEEMPSRFYSLTKEAWDAFNNLQLEPEEVIIFRYLPDVSSDGLIFDISRISN